MLGSIPQVAKYLLLLVTLFGNVSSAFQDTELELDGRFLSGSFDICSRASQALCAIPGSPESLPVDFGEKPTSFYDLTITQAGVIAFDITFTPTQFDYKYRVYGPYSSHAELLDDCNPSNPDLIVAESTYTGVSPLVVSTTADWAANAALTGEIGCPSTTAEPSALPSEMPSDMPSSMPSEMPSSMPSEMPSSAPSTMPSDTPSTIPSSMPSVVPSAAPSSLPSGVPSVVPSSLPSSIPSSSPTTKSGKSPSTPSPSTKAPSTKAPNTKAPKASTKAPILPI